jgi:crotonobetaine/carnitine-CoA ligase
VSVDIRSMLERNARTSPEEVFVAFEGDEAWTRAQGLDEAYRAARVLRARGVGRGDRVALFLDNGPDYLRAWWGAACLGAVLVPINTALRGGMLEHLLGLARPTIMVADATLTDFGSVPRLTPSALTDGPTAAPEIGGPIGSWETCSLNLTSGTTGRSKLSHTTYTQQVNGGMPFIAEWGDGSADVFQADLPLFHLAASYQVAACLATGTRIVVRTRPALGNYWEAARDTGATMALLVSSMVPFLLAQPPRPADREHRIKTMVAAPLPAAMGEFQERFGVPNLVTFYGSTEVSNCLGVSPGEPVVPGSCGTVRPGFELRVADEHDVEVPAGETGQLLVRHREPWKISCGYESDPVATAAAWRNGWFHTGDLFRRDETGVHYFVDRLTDSVRRRGENVSSAEVEAEVLRCQGVAEAACVAVPAEADDDIKVWLVPEAGVQLDLEKIFHTLAGSMTHFMVPRYLEITDELPRTPTSRIRKYLLRERGNSETTWDSAAHGLRISRSRARSR